MSADTRACQDDENSGANPDDDKRHRQGGDEGDGNRRGECAKQIYMMVNVVYRHSLSPLRAHKRKVAPGRMRCRFPLATRVQKGERRWCADTVNERLKRETTWS